MSADKSEVRLILLTLKDEILNLSKTAEDDRKPVGLDQQSVGRLSRQDSLQIQAMAKAADARRAGELRRIEAALHRLEEDEYGFCTLCGEDIELGRLKIDPAAPLCQACATSQAGSS